MKPASLFDDDPAPAKPGAPAASHLLVVPAERAVLSAAARAFNLQLARIDKLNSQMADLDTWAQTHRLALQSRVKPLQREHSVLMRKMVLVIDQQLQGKGLAAGRRRAAVQVLCSLAGALANEGDAAMAELHDRHSAKTLAQQEREDQEELRAQLKAAFGEPPDGMDLEASPDDLLAAAMARLREAAQAEQERRRENAAKKKAKKKPSAAQAAAQLEQQDADTWLRQLFRQLASALHPDREPDPQARIAKTALMSEANAAYGRKDLVALMQIQQRASLAAPDAASRMGDDKLAALTRLLKQQVADLERERAARQSQLAHEFQVPLGLGVTPKTLHMVALEQESELEEALAVMQEDLALVQTDVGFKRWLAEQQKVARHMERMQAELPSDFEWGGP